LFLLAAISIKKKTAYATTVIIRHVAIPITYSQEAKPTITKIEYQKGEPELTVAERSTVIVNSKNMK